MYSRCFSWLNWMVSTVDIYKKGAGMAQAVSVKMGTNDEKREDIQSKMMEYLERIDEQCLRLDALLVNRIQVRDEQVNRLHEELDYYKKDAAGKFENQLLKAVIKIHHGMKKKINSDFFAGKEADQILQEYMYTFEDLTDLLEQQLCDEIESQPGDAFDPAIHQAKLEATDNAALDKTVKTSVSSGYKKAGKVLIPERVIVYQYKNN